MGDRDGCGQAHLFGGGEFVSCSPWFWVFRIPLCVPLSIPCPEAFSLYASPFKDTCLHTFSSYLMASDISQIFSKDPLEVPDRDL